MNVEVRYNGKFFTGPLDAGSAQLAFEALLEHMAAIGAIKREQVPRIKQRGFKNALRPANRPIMNYMWDRMVAAEENDLKVVFSLYDKAGWRFFGRI